MYGILMVLNLNSQLRNSILQIILNGIIMIQLHDKQFVPFISEIEFAHQNGAQVEAIYETPVFVGF
jgi:hypoxanthine phosphoribosyltransferase